MTQPLLVQGNRVCLRDWRQDDLPDYQRWLQPGHKWHETDGPYYPQWTAEEIGARITQLQEGVRTEGWPQPRVRAVISESADSPMIGTVIRYWENEPCRSAFLGISLFPDEKRGKGLGTEALGLWVDYLFSTLNVHRLGLATWSGNTGMIRVAGKLGFTEEARLRQARIVRGELFDGVFFGVLREEWDQLHPRNPAGEERTGRVVKLERRVAELERDKE
ncbi:MAG: GNAT family N-acetyltransferase [Symbiobacteriia bacterium]